eukprot:scaffold62938_cov15-Tisochrysis_lutea.AAC.1
MLQRTIICMKARRGHLHLLNALQVVPVAVVAGVAALMLGAFAWSRSPRLRGGEAVRLLLLLEAISAGRLRCAL